MTITITLAAETEEKLRQRAAASGQTLEAYLQQLVEREARSGNGTPAPGTAPRTSPTFDAILAPVRKGFEESGMTEEELTELFEEAREETWQERQRTKGAS
jgi:hypothetical protein